MVQVFISQPMRNRSDEEIRAERNRIMDYARKLYAGEEVVEIQSFFAKDIESKNVPMRMLGMSIELLAEADVAIFAVGWAGARGSVVEHTCCQFYGVKIIDLDD